jgi:ankyrin repeat protein
MISGLLELVNQTTSDNATPVLIAAQGGHDDCIRLLLDYGADANIPVKELNAIAAHFAIYQNKSRYKIKFFIHIFFAIYM